MKFRLLLFFLRRFFPMLMVVGFLAGTASCFVLSDSKGSSARAVEHGKHSHRHCHEKKHKGKNKHKKFKRHKVCHKHPHRHPHH